MRKEKLGKTRRSSYSYGLRLCAAFTLFFFLFTDLGRAAPLDLRTLEIPEELGRISERSESSNGSDNLSIVHIQDAHSSLQGQEKIAGLVEELSEKHAVEFVGIEGAMGAFPEYRQLQNFPVTEARSKVSEYYLGKGLISGSEQGALRTDSPVTLFGIEEENIFKETFHLFYRLQENSRLHKQIISEIARPLEKLKPKVYNRRLAEFDRFSAALDKETKRFLDVVVMLDNTRNDLSIPRSSFAQVAQLAQAGRKHRDVQSEILKREIESIWKLCDSKENTDPLFREELQKLRSESSNAGAEHLASRLAWLGLKYSFNFQPYPQLSLIKNIERVLQKIDSEKLMDEMEDLTFVLKKKLAVSEEEKTLVDVAHKFEMMERLLLLEGRNRDVDAYFLDRSNFSTAQLAAKLAELCKQRGIRVSHTVNFSVIDKALEDVAKFYQLTHKRDVLFVDNLIRQMKKDKKETAVLVAGGFHTKGISEELKRRGVSYAVVSPNLDRVEKDFPYLDRMTGKLFPLASHLTSYFVADTRSVMTPADYRLMIQGMYRGFFSFTYFVSREAYKLLQQGLIDKEEAARVDAILKQIDADSALRQLLDMSGKDIAYFEENVRTRLESLLTHERVVGPLQTAIIQLFRQYWENRIQTGSESKQDTKTAPAKSHRVPSKLPALPNTAVLTASQNLVRRIIQNDRTNAQNRRLAGFGTGAVESLVAQLEGGDVLLEKKDRVAVITLNRDGSGKKGNAMTVSMLQTLKQIREAVIADQRNDRVTDPANVIILRANGKHFGVGFDTDELKNPAVRGDWQTLRTLWQNEYDEYAAWSQLWARHNVTVVSLTHGLTIGSHMGLTRAGNIVVAGAVRDGATGQIDREKSSKIWALEAERVGIHPDVGIVWHFAKRVSRALTRWYTVAGMPADVVEQHMTNWANAIVEVGRFDELVASIVQANKKNIFSPDDVQDLIASFAIEPSEDDIKPFRLKADYAQRLFGSNDIGQNFAIIQRSDFADAPIEVRANLIELREKILKRTSPGAAMATEYAVLFNNLPTAGLELALRVDLFLAMELAQRPDFVEAITAQQAGRAPTFVPMEWSSGSIESMLGPIEPSVSTLLGLRAGFGRAADDTKYDALTRSAIERFFKKDKLSVEISIVDDSAAESIRYLETKIHVQLRQTVFEALVDTVRSERTIALAGSSTVSYVEVFLNKRPTRSAAIRQAKIAFYYEVENNIKMKRVTAEEMKRRVASLKIGEEFIPYNGENGRPDEEYTYTVVRPHYIPFGREWQPGDILPRNMWAWSISKTKQNKSDPKSALEFNLVPTPEPGPNEVLIQVLATTVSKRDIGIAKGEVRADDLAIGGEEGAGLVVSVDKNVSDETILRPGTPVSISPTASNPLDQQLIGGDPALDSNVQFKQDKLPKLHAQFSVVQAAHVVPWQKKLELDRAAGYLGDTEVAYRALNRSIALMRSPWWEPLVNKYMKAISRAVSFFFPEGKNWRWGMDEMSRRDALIFNAHESEGSERIIMAGLKKARRVTAVADNDEHAKQLEHFATLYGNLTEDTKKEIIAIRERLEKAKAFLFFMETLGFKKPIAYIVRFLKRDGIVERFVRWALHRPFEQTFEKSLDWFFGVNIFIALAFTLVSMYITPLVAGSFLVTFLKFLVPAVGITGALSIYHKLHWPWFMTLDYLDGFMKRMSGTKTVPGINQDRQRLDTLLGSIPEEMRKRVLKLAPQTVMNAGEFKNIWGAPGEDESYEDFKQRVSGFKRAYMRENFGIGGWRERGPKLVANVTGRDTFAQAVELVAEDGVVEVSNASSGSRVRFFGKEGSLSVDEMLSRAKLDATKSVLFYGTGSNYSAIEKALSTHAEVAVIGGYKGAEYLENQGVRFFQDVSEIVDTKFDIIVAAQTSSHTAEEGPTTYITASMEINEALTLVKPGGEIDFPGNFEGRRFGFNTKLLIENQAVLRFANFTIMGNGRGSPKEADEIARGVANGTIPVANPVTIPFGKLDEGIDSVSRNQLNGRKAVAVLPGFQPKSTASYFDQIRSLGLTPEKSGPFKNLREYRALQRRFKRDPAGEYLKLAKEKLAWLPDASGQPQLPTGMHDLTHNYDREGWFVGGKFNISYAALDAKVKAGLGNKVYVYAEKDHEGLSEGKRVITYREMLEQVSVKAQALRKLGVKKGDRVGIYMPMSPEAAQWMMAITRIGAVHSVVFSNFKGDALATRLDDAGARVLITANGGNRRGEISNLKAEADKAIAAHRLNIDKVIVEDWAETEYSMQEGRDVHWPALRAEIKAQMESILDMPEAERTSSIINHRVQFNGASGDSKRKMRTNLRGFNVDFDNPGNEDFKEYIKRITKFSPPEEMDPNDLMFILYTSGTTGKPKGVTFTQGGYALGGALAIEQVFGRNDNDVIWMPSDVGWIVGHNQVYATALSGLTGVIIEGAPTWPRADRMWRIIQEYGVSILALGATGIKMALTGDHNLIKGRPKLSLRADGNFAEPLTWLVMQGWNETINDNLLTVQDTYYKTEDGNWNVAPAWNISPLLGPVQGIPTSGYPLPGIEAAVFVGDEDENGVIDPKTIRRALPGEKGYLLTTRHPWMMHNIYGNRTRYLKSYVDNFRHVEGGPWFQTGDFGIIGGDGEVYVVGRSDDDFNTSGHRIAPSELENAINGFLNEAMKTPKYKGAFGISGAAGVLDPKGLRGHVPIAFVEVKDPSKVDDFIRKGIEDAVDNNVGRFAKIYELYFVGGNDLPKTQSQKIVRRALRDLREGVPIEQIDATTVVNPESFYALKSAMARQRGGAAGKEPKWKFIVKAPFHIISFIIHIIRGVIDWIGFRSRQLAQISNKARARAGVGNDYPVWVLAAAGEGAAHALRFLVWLISDIVLAAAERAVQLPISILSPKTPQKDTKEEVSQKPAEVPAQLFGFESGKEISGTKRKVSLGDFKKYAESVGDKNPIHVNPGYASRTIFGRNISQGMLTASFLDEAIGRHLEKSQLRNISWEMIEGNFQFAAPVFPGDEIQHSLRAQRIDRDKKQIVFSLRVSNQYDAVILSGLVTVDFFEKSEGRTVRQEQKTPITLSAEQLVDSERVNDFSELKLGFTRSYSREVKQSDIENLAALTGNQNPRLKHGQAQSMFAIGLVSTVFGYEFTNPENIYMVWAEQNFKYLGAMPKAKDKLRAIARVIDLPNWQNRQVRMRVDVINEGTGEVIVHGTGTAVFLDAKPKDPFYEQALTELKDLLSLETPIQEATIEALADTLRFNKLTAGGKSYISEFAEAVSTGVETEAYKALMKEISFNQQLSEVTEEEMAARLKDPNSFKPTDAESHEFKIIRPYYLPIGKLLKPGDLLPRKYWAWPAHLNQLNNVNPGQAFRLRLLDMPEVTDNDVLVQIITAALNHDVVFTGTGYPVKFSQLSGLRFAEWQVTGSDGSGVIVDMGNGVAEEGEFGIGEPVNVNPFDGDILNPMSGGGDAMLDRKAGVFGYDTTHGTFGQFALVKRPQLHKWPEGMPADKAGSYLLVFGTVLRSIRRSLAYFRGRSNKTALVFGSTGGTGIPNGWMLALMGFTRRIGIVSSKNRATAATDFRKLFNTGELTEAQQELAESLSYNATVNRKDVPENTWGAPEPGESYWQFQARVSKFIQAVEKANNGLRPMLVSDSTGNSTFAVSIETVAEGGVVTFYGATAGYVLSFFGRKGSKTVKEAFRGVPLGMHKRGLVYGGDDLAFEAIQQMRSQHTEVIVVVKDDAEFAQLKNNAKQRGILSDPWVGVVKLSDVKRTAIQSLKRGFNYDISLDEIARYELLPPVDANAKPVNERASNAHMALISAFRKAIGNAAGSRYAPDVIYERSANDTLNMSFSVLNRGGIVVYSEDLEGKLFRLDARHWVNQRSMTTPVFSIVTTHLANPKEFAEIQSLVNRGKILITQPNVRFISEMPGAVDDMHHNKLPPGKTVFSFVPPENAHTFIPTPSAQLAGDGDWLAKRFTTTGFGAEVNADVIAKFIEADDAAQKNVLRELLSQKIDASLVYRDLGRVIADAINARDTKSNPHELIEAIRSKISHEFSVDISEVTVERFIKILQAAGVLIATEEGKVVTVGPVDPNQWKGKVVIVTGGGTGLGLAITKNFASAGAHVIIDGRRFLDNSAAQRKISDEIKQATGTDITIVPGDVNDNDHLRELFKVAKEKFSAVDIVVNNAGVSGDVKLLPMIPVVNFVRDAMIHLHAWKMAKLATEIMLEQFQATGKSGTILNIGTYFTTPSRYEYRPYPYRTPYTGAQAIKNRITRLFAAEIARMVKGADITVATATPGPFEGARINDVVYPKGWLARLLSTTKPPEPAEIRKKVETLHVGTFITAEQVASTVMMMSAKEQRKAFNGEVVALGGIDYKVPPTRIVPIELGRQQSLKGRTVVLTAPEDAQERLIFIAKGLSAVGARVVVGTQNSAAVQSALLQEGYAQVIVQELDFKKAEFDGMADFFSGIANDNEIGKIHAFFHVTGQPDIEQNYLELDFDQIEKQVSERFFTPSFVGKFASLTLLYQAYKRLNEKDERVATFASMVKFLERPLEKEIFDSAKRDSLLQATKHIGDPGAKNRIRELLERYITPQDDKDLADDLEARRQRAKDRVYAPWTDEERETALKGIDEIISDLDPNPLVPDLRRLREGIERVWTNEEIALFQKGLKAAKGQISIVAPEELAGASKQALASERRAVFRGGIGAVFTSFATEMGAAQSGIVSNVVVPGAMGRVIEFPQRLNEALIYLASERGHRINGLVIDPHARNAYPSWLTTLRDTVALVPGGARNMGASISRRLASVGVKVVAVARESSRGHLRKLVSDIHVTGGEAAFEVAEISDPADISRILEETLRQYHRLDSVITTAGDGGAFASTDEIKPESWRKTLKVDLLAPLSLMAAVIPVMRKQIQNGSIVEGTIQNVGTEYGRRGYLGRSEYSGSKSALATFTLEIGRRLIESGSRINLVNIHPSLVEGPRMYWVLSGFINFFTGKKALTDAHYERMNKEIDTWAAAEKDVADLVEDISTKEVNGNKLDPKVVKPIAWFRSNINLSVDEIKAKAKANQWDDSLLNLTLFFKSIYPLKAPTNDDVGQRVVDVLGSASTNAGQDVFVTGLPRVSEPPIDRVQKLNIEVGGRLDGKTVLIASAGEDKATIEQIKALVQSYSSANITVALKPSAKALFENAMMGYMGPDNIRFIDFTSESEIKSLFADGIKFDAAAYVIANPNESERFTDFYFDGSLADFYDDNLKLIEDTKDEYKVRLAKFREQLELYEKTHLTGPEMLFTMLAQNMEKGRKLIFVAPSDRSIEAEAATRMFATLALIRNGESHLLNSGIQAQVVEANHESSETVAAFVTSLSIMSQSVDAGFGSIASAAVIYSPAVAVGSYASEPLLNFGIASLQRILDALSRPLPFGRLGRRMAGIDSVDTEILYAEAKRALKEEPASPETFESVRAFFKSAAAADRAKIAEILVQVATTSAGPLQAHLGTAFHPSVSAHSGIARIPKMAVDPRENVELIIPADVILKLMPFAPFMRNGGPWSWSALFAVKGNRLTIGVTSLQQAEEVKALIGYNDNYFSPVAKENIRFVEDEFDSENIVVRSGRLLRMPVGEYMKLLELLPHLLLAIGKFGPRVVNPEIMQVQGNQIHVDVNRLQAISQDLKSILDVYESILVSA